MKRIVAVAMLAALSAACEQESEKPLTAPVLTVVSQTEGCLAETTAVRAAAPEIAIYVKGKEVEVFHSNSSFNCCHAAIKKEIAYDAAAETVTLTEREVQGEAVCDCDCSFEVWWRFKLHKTGTFTLAVQRLSDSGSGTVVYSRELAVTGSEKQTFPAHTPADTEVAYPAGYPKTAWPTEISEVTPKYLADEALLALFDMEGAPKSEGSGQTQYKTDDALLTIIPGTTERRINYTVLRERVYFVATAKTGYDAKHAELLPQAQTWADKFTTMTFFRLPTASPYDDNPDAGNISFAAAYQFGVAVMGFWDQYATLSVSFDSQGLIGAEFTAPNEVTAGTVVEAATKAQIEAALSEELSIAADPVAEQIRWRPVDESSAARMLRYYYVNNATGGLYGISMKKTDHP